MAKMTPYDELTRRIITYKDKAGKEPTTIRAGGKTLAALQADPRFMELAKKYRFMAISENRMQVE